jgi:hypothetical protein
MSNLRVYILYRFAEENAVYRNWLEQLPWPYRIVEDFLPEWVVPDDAGVVVTHSHYAWEDLSALRKISQANRVPVLILCDGILEFRNTWDHPQLPEGSMFQPAFGHKIACLGRAPARILESWGNAGKCEVVGLPRLDSFLNSEPPSTRRSGPFRLLVTTAKTPAFNDRQMKITVASLLALKRTLEGCPQMGGRPVEVTWRLTGQVAGKIGLPDIDLRTVPSLLEMIDQSDAVITTPSTIYLESVLRKRPTAFLDFHNCPQYVPSAWRITAASQIEKVLNELADPPQSKMLYQASMLHDQLECRTPATARLFQLIATLIDTRQESLSTASPLRIPARILIDEQAGLMPVNEDCDLAKLFPHSDVFRLQDVQRLQIELAAAIKQLDTLPLELAERQQHIVRVNRFLEEAHMRNREMHLRLNRAEDELQSLKNRLAGQ